MRQQDQLFGFKAIPLRPPTISRDYSLTVARGTSLGLLRNFVCFGLRNYDRVSQDLVNYLTHQLNLPRRFFVNTVGGIKYGSITLESWMKF